MNCYLRYYFCIFFKYDTFRDLIANKNDTKLDMNYTLLYSG